MDDPVYQRDIWQLISQYLRGHFIFEATANIPIFVYEIYLGMPNPTNDAELVKLQKDSLYNIFMFLKIFRLMHLFVL